MTIKLGRVSQETKSNHAEDFVSPSDNRTLVSTSDPSKVSLIGLSCVDSPTPENTINCQ